MVADVRTLMVKSVGGLKIEETLLGGLKLKQSAKWWRE